jgi:hypothetical protein
VGDPARRVVGVGAEGGDAGVLAEGGDVDVGGGRGGGSVGGVRDGLHVGVLSGTWSLSVVLRCLMPGPAHLRSDVAAPQATKYLIYR